MVFFILVIPLWATTYSLQELIDHALTYDATLKAEKELLNQYRAQKGQTQKWDNPELTMGYSRTKPEGLENKNEYSLSLLQSLEKPTLRAAKRSVYDAKIIQAEALIKKREYEVRGDVLQKAYGYLVASMMADTASQSLALATTLRQKGTKRLEQGVISKAEYLKLQVEEAKAQQEYESAQLKQQTAQQRLSSRAYFSSPIDMLPLVLPAPTHDIQCTKEDLPMFRYFQAVDDELKSQKDVVEKSVIPGVKAGISYQKMYDQHTWMATLAIPLPLLHRNEGTLASVESQITENRLREEAYRFETQQTILQYQKTLATLSKLINNQKGVIDQAKVMEKMAQKSYDEGYGTLLELLDARRVLIVSQKDLLLTLESYYDTLGELQKISPLGDVL